MRKTIVGVSMLVGLAGCTAQTGEPQVLGELSAAVSGGTTYQIKFPNLQNKCTDVSSNSGADGANVQLWVCNGSSAQNWVANDMGGGWFSLQHQGTGECLNRSTNVSAGTDGANVQQWTCQWQGSAEYQWRFESSNGHQRAINRYDNKCLDVNGQGTGDGTNIQTWVCNNGNAQTLDMVSGGGGGGGGSSRQTAPYVPTYAPTVDGQTTLSGLTNATGNNKWTLAFVVNQNGSYCTSAFNGSGGLNNSWANSISGLKNMGGTAIASFGGYGGVELAYNCANSNDLYNAYNNVVNTFGLNSVDFDIENGDTITDAVTGNRYTQNHNRVLAIKSLKSAHPGLQVSFTLGVYPSGLPGDQQNLLLDAKNNGLTVDVVNLMTMDFGSCNQNMGQDAIDAANNTHNWLVNNGFSSTTVGITPMLATNDTTCEFFSTGDAQNVLNWAQGNSFVSRLSYWSQQRDDGTYGAGGANSFINIFKQFH